MGIGSMEEIRFKKKHVRLIHRLTKELHFSQEELENILLIYYNIQKQSEDKQHGITKDQFKEFLHNTLDMTDTEITNRIVHTVSRGPSPIITMETWARVMSLFLRGTLEEKIKHCYSVYDIMFNGKIGRDIMVGFLDNCIISSSSDEDPEDAVKDLVEVLAKKIDLDRDGIISFEDYRKSCLAEPALLELLGPCLPSRLAVHSFLTFLTPHVGKL
ncbi:hypothetical protein ILUMI_07328 [Ignelater luminosus]|uniref:EF-hand domain-containing protein n=1 Tax=Ignelater luminosus TaxID=2038154 RepID=A0A8K0D6P4_IGNLU|nr:hypothetical protein ILUMI_07328 [Ignelater luminosus]